MTRAYEKGETTLEDINRSLASYRGHLKHGHTYRLQKATYANFVLRRPSRKNATQLEEDKKLK